MGREQKLSTYPSKPDNPLLLEALPNDCFVIVKPPKVTLSTHSVPLGITDGRWWWFISFVIPRTPENAIERPSSHSYIACTWEVSYMLGQGVAAAGLTLWFVVSWAKVVEGLEFSVFEFKPYTVISNVHAADIVRCNTFFLLSSLTRNWVYLSRS